ncbi:MAG: PAS domain S-box protein, partial [Candidatus Eisenbacteria bacterium]|nr:PAS domain S-box protein [Candidatus Eisenbacteria bacterium]
SVSAIRNRDGSIRHFLGQAQDIGARRVAEAALRASEARYRTIAETTSDIIVLTNLRGEAEYVSPSVRLAGWRPEDLIGKRFVDRLHPDDIGVVKAGVGRLLKTGSVDRLRWRARHGVTGEWRWFESNASLIHDGDGEVTTILDVVRDVHTQVIAAAEIAAARAAAEQAAQAKAQFLANITHEIRTPLTAVLGFTDLLRRRTDLPADAADQIERIEWAGRGLLALVNDVLDFSKLEAGRFEIRPTPTELAALAEEVAAIFEETARSKGLQLDLTLDPDLADAVSLDPDRVRQMLLNLVGNALKFTQEGRVGLAFRTDDLPDWIRVEVSDTGPGIPLEAQGELFLSLIHI